MDIHRRLKIGSSIVVWIGLGVGLLSGCRGGTPYVPVVPAAVADAKNHHTETNKALVAANNQFGLDLFHRLVQTDAGKNVFLSPTSVALALEMTYNGAAGATRQAMAQTLHLQGVDPPALNARNAALQAGLLNPDPAVQLHIAGSIWLRHDLPVNPDFVKTNTTYYGGQVGDLAGAPDNVNAWVARCTNDKIPNILPPDDYSQTIAILVNVVYFKAKWTMSFESNKTDDAPFTLLNGTKQTCRMMHGDYLVRYYKGAGFQAMRLPYGGGRMSMVVVLPDVGIDWNTFLSTLTAQNIESWIGRMQDSSYTVGMPRFHSDYSADLVKMLSALGMGVAFDPNHADFSGMARGAYLQHIYHKSFIEVTEEGTEAAAATVVHANTLSLGAVYKPIEIKIDHPFFYAIRDDKTGALLFLGVVTAPQE